MLCFRFDFDQGFALIVLLGVGYVLEECFDPLEDPELAGEGVKICARVVNEGGGVHNRIAFKKGGREGVVACTHTAVCQMPLGEAAGLLETKVVEFAKSLEWESQEVVLPPWEHFKALRSYVAGVADIGIANVMLASYAGGDPGDLPFGFNDLMQKQLMDAVGKVAPRALDNIKVNAFWELWEGNPEWFKLRFDLLDKRFKFVNLACRLKDPDFLGEVMRAGGAASVLNNCPGAAGEVLASDQTLAGQLARDESVGVRWAVAWNEGTPPAVLEHLARDEYEPVREGVAGNNGTPPAVLEQLGRDANSNVRTSVGMNKSTPPALLEQLAMDENVNVQHAVAINNSTPSAVREKLRNFF